MKQKICKIIALMLVFLMLLGTASLIACTKKTVDEKENGAKNEENNTPSVLNRPTKTSINGENVRENILNSILNIAMSIDYDDYSEAKKQEIKNEFNEYLNETDNDGKTFYEYIISILENAGIKENEVASLCEVLNDFANILKNINETLSNFDYDDDYDVINVTFSKNNVAAIQNVAKKAMTALPKANTAALLDELVKLILIANNENSNITYNSLYGIEKSANYESIETEILDKSQKYGLKTILEKQISDSKKIDNYESEEDAVFDFIESFDFDYFAIFVSESYELIELLANKDSQKLADFLKFSFDILISADFDYIQDIFSGKGRYSYTQIVGYVNFAGEVLIDIANISSKYVTKYSERSLNLIENAYQLLYNNIDIEDEENFEVLFDELYDLAKNNPDSFNAFIRLIGTIMKDLDTATISALYLDFDAANKANTEEQEDLYGARFIVRIAKNINSAYDNLSSKDKTAIKNLINKFIKLIEILYNSDYDYETLKINLTADDIIKDLKKVASYNIDSMTITQAREVRDLFLGYEDKFEITEKEEPGSENRPLWTGEIFIKKGDDVQVLKDKITKYYSKSSFEIQSITGFTNSSTGEKIVSVIYTYHGVTYTDSSYKFFVYTTDDIYLHYYSYVEYYTFSEYNYIIVGDELQPSMFYKPVSFYINNQEVSLYDEIKNERICADTDVVGSFMGFYVFELDTKTFAIPFNYNVY